MNDLIYDQTAVTISPMSYPVAFHLAYFVGLPF